MSKSLRIISINFYFSNPSVVQADLGTDRALFDFDVVVIRPQQFQVVEGKYRLYEEITAVMKKREKELEALFRQGGVLVVFLDAPDTYHVNTGSYSSGQSYSANNYGFLNSNFAYCLSTGKGEQISYLDPTEPFVSVLKKSKVNWTAYITSRPGHPFNGLKFFANAGAGGGVAGKMPYGEGHFIVLPNVTHLDETSFFEACAEYRFKRQGTSPPDWISQIFVPGLPTIETEIGNLDKKISDLQDARKVQELQLSDRAAYRKLLYEKGKVQLEPIVLRALDNLKFGTSSSEIISGTIFEIDGRTTKGSRPGIIEVKGSKKVIALDEFSPLVTKLLSDYQINNVSSKGILVGNGLCEAEPLSRLGNTIFSAHVLEAAKTNSVALVNSVELYALCCALLRGDSIDKNAVREAILTTSGYVDMRPFCGELPFSRK